MILLTGTSSTVAPFETVVLQPKVFHTRQDVYTYVHGQFSSTLQKRGACTGDCLTAGWDVGMTFQSGTSNGDVKYRVYSEKDNGAVTYHLRSDILHIVYRSDDIIGDNISIPVHTTNSSTLYWNTSSHPGLDIALAMAVVSGYVIGSTTKLSTLSYDELASIVPDDDPVTMMMLVYTMLRANDKYALFHVQDGTLYLYADRGFLSADDTVEGFENGIITDPEGLYKFSTMYRDIPSSIDGTVEMYRGMFKPGTDIENQFRHLLSQALLPGVQWKDKVSEIVQLLDVPNGDTNTVSYTLMSIIAKYKLLKGTNLIFTMLPSSLPNRESP